MSRDRIKWIATAIMIADHAAYASVYSGIPALICHIFGKAAAPLMFFFVAEGYGHTKDLEGYAKRLFLLATASQIPYAIFINRGTIFPFHGNVIFTLLLSLLSIHVYETEEDPVVRWSIITAFVILSYLSDWGIFGIMICLTFWIFKDRKAQISMYLFISIVKTAAVYAWYGTGTTFMACAISPIIVALLIISYNGKSGKRHNSLFYAVYPLQFVAFNLFEFVKEG